jgi:hypothetical protein
MNGSPILALALAASGLKDQTENVPYVQSMADGGVFYARCILEGADGGAGKTTIYRVRKDQDEVVDRYAWYSRRGVVLGWSPIAGKVALMSASQVEPAADGTTAALNFYLGGEHRKSYS